jgi:hypothetical protein
MQVSELELVMTSGNRLQRLLWSDSNLCKSAVALYCMYLRVIRRECVTELLINPTNRTRTRHFVTRTTLHVTIFICHLFTDSPSYVQNFSWKI